MRLGRAIAEGRAADCATSLTSEEGSVAEEWAAASALARQEGGAATGRRRRTEG